MPNDTRTTGCCWPECGAPLIFTWPLCTAHQRVAYDLECRRGSDIMPTFRFTADVQDKPEPQRKPQVDGTVYYVQVGAHIKIGWASDLAKRMRSYPPNSQLLATHPGTRDTERKMHRRFAAHRTHGREWYAPVPSLLHHIEQVKGEHGEPAVVLFGAQPVTIPEPRPKQFAAVRSRSGGSYTR